jgi:hypothetical protein
MISLYLMVSWQMAVIYLYKQDVAPFCFGIYTQNGVA